MTIGIDIAGLALASIGLAHLAVIAYQEARPGRTARSLHRKLNNERAIYAEFFHRLMAPYVPAADITKFLTDPEKHPLNLQDVHLKAHMSQRLGAEILALVLETLEEMNILLKSITSELKNMTTGTKALAKIRTNVKVRLATRPMSSVNRNLTQLTDINKELRRLVSGSATPARPQRRQTIRNRFLHRDHREPEEVYKTICGVFPCQCSEPHIANIGCQCPSCHFPLRQDTRQNHKWTIELVLVPTKGDDEQVCSDAALDDHESTTSVPSSSPPMGHDLSHRGSLAISLDEPPPSLRDSPTEPIRDLCSVINADASLDRSLRSLGIMGRAKQYDLRLIGHDTEGSADGHIVTLSDLIHIDNQSLTRRQRMQIAFQLCLSVLQLYQTPWVDDAWNWQESCSLRLIEEPRDNESDNGDEEEKREFPHIFITKKFYSQGQGAPPPAKKNTTLRILAGDPVLAKLGFALIVLAVNRTLAEVRRVDKGFGDINHGEAELDDLVTAKQLLKTGRIRDEAGRAYEQVVRACIEGQYVDFQDATKQFRKSDADNFFDDAEEAIMHPLFTCFQDFA